MRSATLARVVAAAAGLLLLAPGAAYADNVTVDGDTAVTSTNVALSGACSLPSTEIAGLVEVKRTGNSKHFTAGTTVGVAYRPGTSQVRVTGPATASVPVDYNSNGQSRLEFGISTQVMRGSTAASLAGSTTVEVAVSGTATDGKPYTETGRYLVTWDCTTPVNTPPAVTVAGVAHDAEYEFGAIPVPGCLVTDTEDGSRLVAPTVSALSGPRAGDGLGQQTVTCTATDSGGLTGSATATYVVQDTTAPVLPTLPDVRVEATSADGARVDYTSPVASDAVDGNVAAVCAPAPGLEFPLGATTVECTATDREGNSSTASFTMTVADSTAPTLSLPDSVTLDATSPSGRSHAFTATASDAVSGDVAVTCTPASGSQFPFGATTVSCSASDTTGNTANGSFVVTVQDVTAPTVTVPGNTLLEAEGPAGAALQFAASATDDVDGPLPVTCDPASESTFAIDADTVVTCGATDTHGNAGTASFVVSVRDTRAPALSLPADLVLEATGPLGAVATYAPTAEDLVDGAVPVTCTAPSGTELPLGTTTVACSATDAHANVASGSFTVTVQDTIAPELPRYTDVLGIEATSATGATVEYEAGTARDVVDGEVSVTCAPASGSTFALGGTTVTCEARDAAGNVGRAGFVVSVVDTTAPHLDLPANTVVEATASLTAIEYGEVTASDAVDASPVVTCTPASGSSHPLGVVTVACTAVDDYGNTGFGSFTVTVQDTTQPVVDDVDNLTVEATSAAGAVVHYGPVGATDAVAGQLTADCTPPSESVFALGTTTVTCTASDGSRNTGENSFSVRVQDTTAPTVSVPAPIQVTASSAAGAVVPFTATALDVVDGAVPVACTAGGAAVTSGSVFGLGATTVTCVATDAAGNAGSATFLVNVTVGWDGFRQPLTPGGPTAFKLNSTIPVKFALGGASAGVSDLVARLYVRPVGGGAPSVVTAGVATGSANSGNLFRWDADGRQYVFNLSTKSLGAGTYELYADLGDGVDHTVQVVIRR